MKLKLIIIIALSMAHSLRADLANNTCYPKSDSTFEGGGEATYENLMTSTAGWYAAACSIEQYTDTDVNQFSQADGETIKITKSSGTYCTMYMTPTNVNWANCYFRLKYYIPSQSDVPNSVAVRIADDVSNYYQIVYLPAQVGYHSVEFSYGGMDKNLSPDNTQISTVAIYLFSGTDANSIAYIDSFQVIPNYSKPRIVLSFDDGLSSQYTNARPLLNSHDYKAHFYVDQSRIDTSGFMTTAQLLQLQLDGHLVGSDGNYGQDWTTYRHWQRCKDILENRRWLESIGIGRGRFYFGMPNGSYWFGASTDANQANDRLKFIESYNLHTRLTSFPRLAGNVGFLDGTCVSAGNTFPNPGTFYGLSSSSYTYGGGGDTMTLAEGQAVVDKILLNNELAVLYWHEIKTGGDMEIADFAQFLDYIHANGVEVVTFEDLAPWSNRYNSGINNSAGLKSGGKQ